MAQGLISGGTSQMKMRRVLLLITLKRSGADFRPDFRPALLSARIKRVSFLDVL